jgi:hypothetical protein
MYYIGRKWYGVAYETKRWYGKRHTSHTASAALDRARKSVPSTLVLYYCFPDYCLVLGKERVYPYTLLFLYSNWQERVYPHNSSFSVILAGKCIPLHCFLPVVPWH